MEKRNYTFLNVEALGGIPKSSMPNSRFPARTIRGPVMAPTGPILAGAGSASSADDEDAESIEIKVTQETVTEKELSERLEDPSTVGGAPTMPLLHVAPEANQVKIVELDSADNSDTTEFTWGLEACGVVDSSGSKRAHSEGSNVAMAIVDTGIDDSHPAFNDMQIYKKNFTAGSDDDTNGHGTHVAGTAAGQDLPALRIGVARDVQRLYAAKVIGPGSSTTNLVDGVTWAIAENRMQSQRNGRELLVINMSIGLDYPGHVKQFIADGMDEAHATSIALTDYARNLRMLDLLGALVEQQAPSDPKVLLVAASGNESDRLADPQILISASPPAEANFFLPVGAVKKTTKSNSDGLDITSFSNTACDLVGPGDDVLSAWPGGQLAFLPGTSMASPHIAGVAALIWDDMVRNGQIVSGGNPISDLVTDLKLRAVTAPNLLNYHRLDYGYGLGRY